MSDTNITIWSSKSFNSILRVLLNKKEPIYHISISPEEPTEVKILKWSEYKLLHEPCKRPHLTTKTICFLCLMVSENLVSIVSLILIWKNPNDNSAYLEHR